MVSLDNAKFLCPSAVAEADKLELTSCWAGNISGFALATERWRGMAMNVGEGWILCGGYGRIISDN